MTVADEPDRGPRQPGQGGGHELFLAQVGQETDAQDLNLLALLYHLQCVIQTTRVLMTRPWATATIRRHLQAEIDELLEDIRISSPSLFQDA